MSGINRVSTLAQQTQNLLNLLRNEQSLNDVLLQQSTGNKAPTYAGVAPQAGQLLNVDSLQNQAQGFLDNINQASTRLTLTDTALTGIGSLATNFQQELQQLASSPTPPNIGDLARTSLQQLASLLDSSDGSQFLFSGSQQSAAPITSINTTRIATKTLTLAGNLDTQGLAPANGNVAPPAAGSFVDVSLAGQNAVFDSNGHQYDTTVRFVHQSAGPPNKWQAYLVAMTRTDDPSQSATFNGQAISATNPVAIGKTFDPSVSPPFNQVGNVVPANALQFDNIATAGVPQIALPPGGGTIAVNVDANQITNTAGASTFSEIDNATATSRVVLNQLNLDPNAAVGDSISINLSGKNALFAGTALAGHDKLDATLTLTKTQAFDPRNGQPELWQASLTSLTDDGNQTGIKAFQPAAGGAGYAIGDTITFNTPPGGVAATALVTAVGVGGAVTGLQVVNPGRGYAAAPVQTATSGAGAGLTVAATFGGAVVTNNPISQSTPYVIAQNFQPAQFAVGANINIGLSGSGTTDAAGSSFTMLVTPPNPNTGTITGLQVRAGTVTTNPPLSGTTSATSIASFDVNPNPPPGTPQVIELSGNLSSATPVNISVATPTAGSFTDLQFRDAQALVDSSGNAHDLTLRIIKTVQKGVAGAPKDLYQLYAIGLTAVESGKGSTNPPITTTAPVAIGAPFDPTAIAAGATQNFTFTPTLANGASMSVTIPVTSTTFDLQGGNILLTAPENSSTAASTTANGQLNLVGNLSSAAAANTLPTGIGSLNITAGGAGFNVGDVITFNTPGGGSPAKATVTSVNAGAITGIQVTNPGAGYVAAPTIFSVAPAGGAGATFTANLGPSLTDITGTIGGITALAVSAGGTGYANGDTVTFAAPPGGTAATATVTAVAGVITGFTIVDPGSGYTSTSNLAITATTGVGTGGIATPTLSPVNASNTVDVNFFGNQALRDSTGKAYDATVRVLYGKIGGASAGWRAYVTSLTDPTTGLSALTAANLPVLIGSPPFDVFHPQDAALGPITIPANGPQKITVPGAGTLSLTIPFNTENFTSNAGVNALTVGGQSTASLAANIADTTYFQPGGKVFDTSQKQLQLRTAADSVVKFGVRADDPTFEQLFRVLNFFKDQSTPATPGEVQNASRLVQNAIDGINALRAGVANTQTVLKSEQNFHQTTINLAKETHGQILTADSATTAMNLNALSNLLQESFATLGTIKSLSLVNFLK